MQPWLLIEATQGSDWELKAAGATALGLGLHQLYRRFRKKSRPKQVKSFKGVMLGVLLGVMVLVVIGLMTIVAMMGFGIPLAGFFAAALATLCSTVSVVLVLAGIIGLFSLMEGLLENVFKDTRSFMGIFLRVILVITLAFVVLGALSAFANIAFFGLFLALKLPFFLAAEIGLEMLGVFVAGLGGCFALHALLKP